MEFIMQWFKARLMDFLLQKSKALQPAHDNVGRLKLTNKETHKRLHLLLFSTTFLFLFITTV